MKEWIFFRQTDGSYGLMSITDEGYYFYHRDKDGVVNQGEPDEITGFVGFIMQCRNMNLFMDSKLTIIA